jgi:chondroitin 4-sulfotransferase 11
MRNQFLKSKALIISNLIFNSGSIQIPQIPSAFRRDNVIFVHVPKAAGSTINLGLFGYRIGHSSIGSFWQADPAFTEQAFKFSFVRHPYLRFVSAYRYLLKGGMSSRDAEYSQCYAQEFASLRSFAEASEQADFRKAIIHLRPQWEFLSLPANAPYKVFMDYVGKTEFLNEHINMLSALVSETIATRLTAVKETRLNATQYSGTEIDTDVFQKIRLIYQDDFELFGYDEWGTVDKCKELLKL